MSEKYNKNNYSYKLSRDQYHSLINFLNENKFLPHSENELEQIYKIKNSTVHLYKNQQILIQGSNVVGLVKEFKLPFVQYQKSNQLDELSVYAGCDEAGNGWFFGGISTAIAYADSSIVKKLAKFNITDSKLLDDNYIMEIAPQISKICHCVVCDIDPVQYNKLYEIYKNANVIKTFAHDQCISKFQQAYFKHNKQRLSIVMDEYCSKFTYDKYLKLIHNKKYDTNIHNIDVFTTHAETKYLGVAAASIVARYTFINQFNKLIKMAKLNLPMGSSNVKLIKKTIDELKLKYGEKSLNKFIKLHFSLSKGE